MSFCESHKHPSHSSKHKSPISVLSSSERINCGSNVFECGEQSRSYLESATTRTRSQESITSSFYLETIPKHAAAAFRFAQVRTFGLDAIMLIFRLRYRGKGSSLLPTLDSRAHTYQKGMLGSRNHRLP